jgi:hypothetical protein
MVKRLMLGERKQLPNSGSFQKGNRASVGANGNNAAARMTKRFISQSIFHHLTQLDPRTQQRQIDRLVDAVVKRGIREGDVNVLRMLNDRMEGSPLQSVAFRDYTEQREPVPMINRNMSPQEAARIMKQMLTDGDDDDDPKAAAIARQQDDELKMWTDEDETPPRLPPPTSQAPIEDDDDEEQPPSRRRGSAEAIAETVAANAPRRKRAGLNVSGAVLDRAKRRR